MARVQKRLDDLNELLRDDVIDLAHLRDFCHHGVPEKPGCRSKCWKLLLDYLPAERATWPEFLAKSRKQYQDFLHDFIINTHDDSSTADTDPLGVLSANESGTRKWDDYFKENEFLEQINKDVRRLNPDFSFFQQPTGLQRPTPEPLSHRVQRAVSQSATVERTRQALSSLKSKATEDGPGELGQNEEQHWEVIERVLFVYAKLNPGVKYVQGMNEILGPIYYCFATDPDPNTSRHAEADAFFCFTNLMSEIRDVFIKSLDNSETGIGALMLSLERLLEQHKPELAKALADMSLKPQFYGFRWLTLLLSQEFRLPDVMRLWDTLFASRDRLTSMLYVCMAMLDLVSDVILERDFATSLKMLQSYPEEIEVTRILRNADQLQQQIAKTKLQARYSGEDLNP
eukprot:m.135478 g.135478  ORF g.135478 m.135478 type:complete len:400 (+) comp15995_c0_seq3:122-1321(+)